MSPNPPAISTLKYRTGSSTGILIFFLIQGAENTLAPQRAHRCFAACTHGWLHVMGGTETPSLPVTSPGSARQAVLVQGQQLRAPLPVLCWQA